MLMRIIVITNSAEQETEVIFDAALITPVPGLLEMKARRRVLNQRTVYVITALFDRAKIFQHRPELVVESPLDCVILTRSEQRRSFSK
jgi:hypothetical protein